jgi:hypothetical protein
MICDLDIVRTFEKGFTTSIAFYIKALKSYNV